MKAEAKKQVSVAGRLLRLVPSLRQAKPRLSLRPSVDKVRADASLSVEAKFAGVDRVEFELEPKNTFVLDAAALEKSGVIRMLAKADGKCTLVATGVRRGEDVIQRLVHVECEGHVVRILAYGYTPKEG